jgi:D-glycero-alpha-D-manno-heptose-7-phosphate kinase
MIITRTPFRISFAGGGSDLEACYSVQPGAVLCTAIDKYMYVAVKEHFGSDFRVSYSRTEFAASVDAIQHPIVRECLKLVGAPSPLEIVSMADLPAHAGMGSSSSFTVGLLHALHANAGKLRTAEQLARDACHIEIDRLEEPIGKQDQYIAAYGGLQFLQFNPDGTVFVEPVICPEATSRELTRRLLVFFTGLTRPAREVLERQRNNTPNHLPALREMSSIARAMRDLLANGGDLSEFGRLLHSAWEAKKGLESSITNHDIDDIYARGLRAGALGGKLLGAGNGGFVLFFCEPERQAALREELAGLTEVPVAMEPEGSRIVYVGAGRP